MKIVPYNDEQYYEVDNSIKITKSTKEWAKKIQLSRIFKINKDTCPKEEKIMYSKNGRVIKIFGKRIRVKGLFRLPSFVSIKTEKVRTTKLNQHMFPKTLFLSKEARVARKYLCSTCPINNCNYRIK